MHKNYGTFLWQDAVLHKRRQSANLRSVGEAQSTVLSEVSLRNRLILSWTDLGQRPPRAGDNNVLATDRGTVLERDTHAYTKL